VPVLVDAGVGTASDAAIALELGFRTGDPAAFTAAAQKAGLALENQLNQVVDPPSFDLMFEMIDIVSKEMNQ
jgi:hypothetical protein